MNFKDVRGRGDGKCKHERAGGFGLVDRLAQLRDLDHDILVEEVLTGSGLRSESSIERPEWLRSCHWRTEDFVPPRKKQT